MKFGLGIQSLWTREKSQFQSFSQSFQSKNEKIYSTFVTRKMSISVNSNLSTMFITIHRAKINPDNFGSMYSYTTHSQCSCYFQRFSRIRKFIVLLKFWNNVAVLWLIVKFYMVNGRSWRTAVTNLFIVASWVLYMQGRQETWLRKLQLLRLLKVDIQMYIEACYGFKLLLFNLSNIIY